MKYVLIVGDCQVVAVGDLEYVKQVKADNEYINSLFHTKKVYQIVTVNNYKKAMGM